MTPGLLLGRRSPLTSTPITSGPQGLALMAAGVTVTIADDWLAVEVLGARGVDPAQARGRVERAG
ncbi:MAG: hypothetical protein ACR2JF_18225 [Iamia sp.]